jgi:hypothetical protein
MMIFDNRIAKGLAIGVVAISLTTFYVLSEHNSREYLSIQQVESQIQAIENNALALTQMKNLPALQDTWRSLESIASSFDVKIKPLDTPKDAGISDTDIPGGQPWFGVLQGQTKNVSVAAIEIQQALPILYGSAVLDNDMMGLGFALLGSTETTTK